MRCISPLLITKNGRRDIVPCGRCNFCLQDKQFAWSFRLGREWKVSDSAYFLTFTYDDSNLPLGSDDVPTLCKRDYVLFTKRLRKENLGLLPRPIRYYSVGEYGTRTLRPHYHSIMFNMSSLLERRLADIWSLGFVDIRDCSAAAIHYVTKYCINKPGEYKGREPPFALMSRRPGIGANYVETHREYHRSDFKNYTNQSGIKGKLPRYYKDKFFDQAEKNMLKSQGLELSEQAYQDELTRLAQFHDDPSWYYEERRMQAHEKIKSKCNQFNKF